MLTVLSDLQIYLTLDCGYRPAIRVYTILQVYPDTVLRGWLMRVERVAHEGDVPDQHHDEVASCLGRLR